MVSHVDERSTVSLPVRHSTARSLISRASSSTATRRHRHTRSHHGGSTQPAQSVFPWFTSGNVEIIITSGRKEQRYLLHKLILSQCSGFFEASTSEGWSRSQPEPNTQSFQSGALARIGEDEAATTSFTQSGPGSQVGDGRRWRYELDWGSSEQDIPMLVQKDASSSLFGGDEATSQPPPVRNKPQAPQSGFFRSMANFSAVNMQHGSQEPVDDILRDYDNLFRIFYNYPPALDAVYIATAYVECKSLLQLADMYDALEVVGPRVDHHLLRFQGRLWKQIAKYPPSYLKLGYLARSRVIFSEAMVHVVGQWPAGANQLRGQIDNPVMELIEDKVDELEETKARVESRLFRITLTTSRGDRVTPHNSMLDWLAVSLFRQWVAENTTPPPAPILKDRTRPGSTRNSGQNAPLPPPPINTGRIYRLLGTGSQAYLPHEELKRFLKLRPEDYNRESLKKFERRVEDMKNLARDAVKPLMRSFLELDLGRDGGGLPYLTCTRLDDADFPWDD
ncbi:hypothetical protein EV356DRAFT_448954 [Viridothelium virens]|uniref:BTB domain-containing protein n=1 Tax=Viridothelium virens TaxID=1048519 RepID=A0A6A6H5M3_VIRVR|nr:hypothetical protein EV356DRAFT_448954 [Viridothelium virens]